MDNNIPVTVYFPVGVQTTVIQIEPVTWFNYPSIRFELLGCRGDYLCSGAPVRSHETIYCPFFSQGSRPSYDTTWEQAVGDIDKIGRPPM